MAHRVLQCFADESSDGSRARSFAIAGLIAPDDLWATTERLWTERTRGKVFHAADCESEFAHSSDSLKHKENLRLYADLTQIIAQSGVSGYAVALDLTAYYEHFPDIPAGSEYFKCFTHLVNAVTEWAATSAEATTPLSDAVVQFTFDQRAQTEHNSSLLYQTILASAAPRQRRVMAGELRSATRQNPRIQMADLVAREMMKELDRQLAPRQRERRKSLVALASAGGRLQFEILTRDYVVSWRQQFASLEARVAAEDGFGGDSYRAWLVAERVTDNFSSRFRYMQWHTAQHREPKP
jgi:hypothetical protein